jgi:hypothetical protein
MAARQVRSQRSPAGREQQLAQPWTQLGHRSAVLAGGDLILLAGKRNGARTAPHLIESCHSYLLLQFSANRLYA